MNANPILPIEIDFKNWASQIRIDIPFLDFPNPPDDPAEWRGWASQVVGSIGDYNITANTTISVPDPTSTTFPKDEDWKNWAAYFVESIYNNNI